MDYPRVSYFKNIIKVEDEVGFPDIEDMDPYSIYLVYYDCDPNKEMSKPTFVVFLCPTGCGEQIVLGVSGMIENHSSPSWTIQHNSKDIISITPSIVHQHSCKGHYFITKNQVKWC